MANPRSVDVQPVQILDQLEAMLTLPTTPPNAEQRIRIETIAFELLREALARPENEGKVLWASVGFPQTGPATYGLLWAINPRHPTGDHFRMTYSETNDDLPSLDEVQIALARYAVAQFGKPKSV